MSRIDKELREALLLLKDTKFKYKNIVIFGSGKFAHDIYGRLKDTNQKIYGVIDNSPQKIGQYFYEFEIQYAPDFLSEKPENTVYIVYTKFYDEIKLQLENYGLKEDEDFFSVISRNSIEYEDAVIRFNLGYEVYKRILNEYSEYDKYLLYHIRSIGDLYVLSLHIDSYFKIHKDKKMLFICSTNLIYKLAKELGIKNVALISFKDITNLMRFLQVFKLSGTKFKFILLHSHAEVYNMMITYSGGSFVDRYREIFNLPLNTKPSIKYLKPNQNEIDELFEKHNLKKGKTVLIAPYAATEKELPLSVWETIAERFIKMGYSVCTNVASEQEKVIKGTVSLFVSINSLGKFVKDAGLLIAVRSGMCDFICAEDCKKIIIYGKESRVYTQYRFGNMGVAKNMTEIIYETPEKLIKTIFDLI